MKIIVSVHHFPPRYTAGAEIYTYRLAKWLLDRGHSVRVVCVESTEPMTGLALRCDDDELDGIPVSRLHVDLARGREALAFPYRNPAIGSWFADLLSRERPDVVHVNSCYLVSTDPLAEARSRGVPVVLTLHDSWFLCPRINLLKPTGETCLVPDDPADCSWCLAMQKRRFRWPHVLSGGAVGTLARPLLRSPATARAAGIRIDATDVRRRRQALAAALELADVILSPTRFLQRLHGEGGVDPARITVSRIGLDTSGWEGPLRRRRTEAGRLRLAYLGQIAPHKGVHLLVRAFETLRPTGTATLALHGDCDAAAGYGEAIRARARANGAIEIRGPFDNRRIAEVLATADVVVAPSLAQENSPLSVLEALASGAPVVAADVGAMSELIEHGGNGLLFERGNAAALAAQLQRFLDEPGLHAALAANARPVRGLDDEMEHLLGVYRRLAAGGSAGA